MAEEGIPLLWRGVERDGAVVFLYFYHIYRDKKSLQQLISVPGPIAGGRGNPFCRGKHC